MMIPRPSRFLFLRRLAELLLRLFLSEAQTGELANDALTESEDTADDGDGSGNS